MCTSWLMHIFVIACRSTNYMQTEKQVLRYMHFLKGQTIVHVFSTDAL